MSYHKDKEERPRHLPNVAPYNHLNHAQSRNVYTHNWDLPRHKNSPQPFYSSFFTERLTAKARMKSQEVTPNNTPAAIYTMCCQQVLALTSGTGGDVTTHLNHKSLFVNYKMLYVFKLEVDTRARRRTDTNLDRRFSKNPIERNMTVTWMIADTPVFVCPEVNIYLRHQKKPSRLSWDARVPSHRRRPTGDVCDVVGTNQVPATRTYS